MNLTTSLKKIWHWAFVLSLLLAVSLRAETILEENFDSLPTDAKPKSKNFEVWEGPPGEVFGTVKISEAAHSGATGKSAGFIDSSPKVNQAPFLRVQWLDKIPKDGHIIISWKWMVKVEPPFISQVYVGSAEGWKEASSVFILEHGRIIVFFDASKSESKVVGSYQSLEWHNTTYDFDVSAKTFDVYLDGKKVVEAHPIQSTAKQIVGTYFAASFADKDYAGDEVFYVDEIKVESKP